MKSQEIEKLVKPSITLKSNAIKLLKCYLWGEKKEGQEVTRNIKVGNAVKYTEV